MEAPTQDQPYQALQVLSTCICSMCSASFNNVNCFLIRCVRFTAARLAQHLRNAPKLPLPWAISTLRTIILQAHMVGISSMP